MIWKHLKEGELPLR